MRRPVAVQWLVTAACDLKCPNCYAAAGKRGSGELGTEEAKRLVTDELVALGRPLLVLAGGELLLRRDIPELVDYACSRGLEWAMHTHGMRVESLSRGASVQLNRLDVLWCPEATTLKIAGDRELEIPARTEVTLLSTLCSICHLSGIHAGTLRASPPASRIRWEIGRDPILVVEGRTRGRLA